MIFIATVLLAIGVTRSLSQCTSSDNEIAFRKFGTYREYNNTSENSEYQKTYFLSRNFTTTAMEARAVCQAFGYDLASFDTFMEYENFKNKIFVDPDFYPKNEYYIIIDGMTSTPKSTTEWYLSKNGKKISWNMQWATGEPNFYKGIENCLSYGGGRVFMIPGLNDYPCSADPANILCQRFDYYHKR